VVNINNSIPNDPAFMPQDRAIGRTLGRVEDFRNTQEAVLNDESPFDIGRDSFSLGGEKLAGQLMRGSSDMALKFSRSVAGKPISEAVKGIVDNFMKSAGKALMDPAKLLASLRPTSTGTPPAAPKSGGGITANLTSGGGKISKQAAAKLAKEITRKGYSEKAAKKLMKMISDKAGDDEDKAAKLLKSLPSEPNTSKGKEALAKWYSENIRKIETDKATGKDTVKLERDKSIGGHDGKGAVVQKDCPALGLSKGDKIAHFNDGWYKMDARTGKKKGAEIKGLDGVSSLGSVNDGEPLKVEYSMSDSDFIGSLDKMSNAPKKKVKDPKPKPAIAKEKDQRPATAK